MQCALGLRVDPLERRDAPVPLDHAGQQSCSCWTKSLAAQVKVGSSQRHMEGVALECAEAARRATEQGIPERAHTLVFNGIAFDTASLGNEEASTVMRRGLTADKVQS